MVFKNHSKVKKAVHIILFMILLLAAEAVLTFVLEPYTMQEEVDRQLSYKEVQGIEPDMVALGDSTVGCGMEPHTLAKTTEGVHFVLNAASANQPVEGSYYYLRYLKKKYPGIRYAVMGLTYDQLIDSQTNMQKKLLVLDRIHDPEIWLSYAQRILSIEDLPLLLKSYRYRARRRDILATVSDKIGKYSAFMPTDDIGYTPNETRLDPEKGEVGIGDLHWDESAVDQNSKEALQDIIDFCHEEGISLTLVTMPVGDALFYSNDGIDPAHQYIEEIAAENGITYLDFNLWNQREEENVDGQMSDNVHIMHALSTELSEVTGKIMNGESPDRFLYSSVAEAREQIHGILHVELTTTPNEDGSRLMSATWICTDNLKPDFRFLITDESGKILLDSGKQSDSTAILPAELVGQKMICSVTAYASDGNREFQKTYSISVDGNTWSQE